MIDITQERYDKLIQAENKLAALEAAGVDDWEWYGDAMDTLGGQNG